jgi:hypothetical protein
LGTDVTTVAFVSTLTCDYVVAMDYLDTVPWLLILPLILVTMVTFVTKVTNAFPSAGIFSPLKFSNYLMHCKLLPPFSGYKIPKAK